MTSYIREPHPCPWPSATEGKVGRPARNAAHSPRAAALDAASGSGDRVTPCPPCLASMHPAGNRLSDLDLFADTQADLLLDAKFDLRVEVCLYGR